AKRLVQGNCVAQGHIAAKNINLFLLEKAGVKKIVVHVRDPRQAMLSWIHYIENLHNTKSLPVLDYPLCDHYFSMTHEQQIVCKAYFNKPFDQKIDQHIEQYYPLLLQWLSGWIAAEENPKTSLKIKFTYFDDYKKNPEKFYSRILSFFDIDIKRFDMTESNLQRKSHYRSGAINEFRNVFTPVQMKRLNTMTPDRIFDKFQWEK
ncbi:MAG: sulfotransferase domain-containing protein, partial [Proteobacteria bacterium]|nr:sulfotransferase domain-containing protein [Pseudomonadota bacterium]